MASEKNINLDDYNLVTEGSTTILFPKSNAVFYNPVQEFNRDLSISVIRTWSEHIFQNTSTKKSRQANRVNKKRKLDANDEPKVEQNTAEKTISEPKKFTILEALSATGLRAIRYAKEIPNLKYVVANDLEESAVEAIKRNIEHNGLTVGDIVRPNKGDACTVMYSHREQNKRFQVVDLDPYGTASPFLDGAVQSVADGGLLCVTCTDLALLAGGNYPEKCFANYGGSTLRTEACHEGALRLVLHAIQTSASRYQRVITPLISLSIDFYIRLFVTVHTSASEVKKVPSKTIIPYFCHSCHATYIQPLGSIMQEEGKPPRYKSAAGPPVGGKCEECNGRLHLAGPMWGGCLHDKEFVEKVLEHVKEHGNTYKTSGRIEGMLTVAKEELDVPSFFSPHKLSSVIHCSVPPLVNVCSALLNGGYKVSGSHAQAGAIKTNADYRIIWDIMRCWVRDKMPVKIRENTPQQRILSKEPTFQASFESHPNAIPPSRKIKLVRYQINPEPNWGPKSRAGTAPKHVESSTNGDSKMKVDN